MISQPFAKYAISYQGQKQPQQFVFLIGQGHPLPVAGDGVGVLVQDQARQVQQLSLIHILVEVSTEGRRPTVHSSSYFAGLTDLSWGKWLDRKSVV